MRAVALVTLIALVACGESAPNEGVKAGRAASPIIGGRTSGDDENAAVYIETKGQNLDGSEVTLRCSGRIIAPGLAVTARHCLLKRKSENVQCNPDGSPVNVAEATDVRVEPASAVTVFIGSDKAALRSVAVKEIFTELDVTVCRADIAFMTLAEIGLDVRTPIRRAEPNVGETVSVTGWGYTSDARVALPTTRSTIDAPITETGPGLIPADTFALGGNTVCLGDSGASALAKGALLGVYSRIEDPTRCTFDGVRNIFVWAGAHTELAESAYAAIGETPWYEGEPRPWLAKDGAHCTKDDECQSSSCDATTSTCRTPCGADGGSCEEAGTPPPSPPPAAADDGGCAIGRAHATRANALPLAALFVLALALRRRARCYSRRAGGSN